MKLPTREEVLKRPFKASRQETLMLLHVNAALLGASREAVGVLSDVDCGYCGIRNKHCQCDDGEWFRDLVAAVAKAEGSR